MKWLDDYIDRMRERMTYIKPVNPQFTRIGAIFNAVVSSAIVAFGISFGINQSPFGFVFALAASAMAAMFIRIAVRALRGDFDQS